MPRKPNECWNVKPVADDKMQDDFNVAESHQQVTPGELLRRHREAAGMSRDDLGSRLQLHPRTMAALEEDRFDALPEPPFVRGYLRGLAKVLEIDPAPLVEAYEACVQGAGQVASERPRSMVRTPGPVASERPAQSRPKTPPGLQRASVSGTWIALVGLLLAGVLGAVVWYVSTLGSSPQQTDATASAPSSVRGVPGDEPEPLLSSPSPRESPQPPANAQPESPERLASLEPQAPSASVEPEPASAPPEPVAQEQDQERAPPDLPPGQGRLELRFEEDSWVEISGADGGRLLVGLMRQGSERRIEGATPIRVFLGNAPGVRLEYNHRPVELEGRVRSDNTARFTVGGS
ncbi:helix-turn-helix domain-containing protein [Ectothiorhodospira marina]|uniref:Cytoskeleton protein RodZ n=1 Tax=Ectothiorhodospira marina TaxID=1396821 RepID=A0A1H7FKE3_9GAMM|nr:helix-turn-helix domain-containing protein [Ectothiorhodospira marina]SEK26573.1 cytoskeleton protein RodZ [Ectothiorhodospira marina]